MKTIQLTQGKVSKICDCHYEQIAKYKWCYSGSYACRGVWNKTTKKTDRVLMHRIIAGSGKGDLTDHINQDKLDNRCSNLRIVSPQKNILNRPVRSDSKSGVKNVLWQQRFNKWLVQFVIDGKKLSYGLYKDLAIAIDVAEKARKELYAKK